MISGYCLENLILERANLNKFLPVIPYYDHGWMLCDTLPKGFENNPSKIHLSWNLRSKSFFKNIKNKECYIIGAPFLHHKDKFQIKKKNNKNTLFFFSHGTSKINLEINLEKLFNDLSKVPESLKPIDVCLHYNDLKFYKPYFEKNNFKTFSAGNIYSDNFTKNFYDLISEYSYTCSNIFGTYTLYSLNLDIPFFFVGDEPVFNNFGKDKNIPFTKYKISDYDFVKKIYPLFYGINKKVTSEQRNLASEELGEFTRVDKNTLKKILLKSYLSIFSNLNNLNAFTRSLLRPIMGKYKLIFDK